MVTLGAVAAAAAALISAVSVAWSGNVSHGLLWKSDFEGGDLSQWTLAPQEKAPGRISVVTSPVRDGGHALRVEVDPGDNNVAGSGSGERAEIGLSQATTGGYEGSEEWWAWSTMFAPGFTSLQSSDWNYFAQFHNTAPYGQSNVHWSADGKLLRFTVCSGDPVHPRCRTWTIDRNRQNGRWYDFVFHVKWSSAYNGGLVELWENGKKVVRLTTLRTLYAGQGVYFKQGIYRTAQSNVAVVYDDGTRRGTSYAAVVADFPPGEWPAKPPALPQPPKTANKPPRHHSK